MDFDWDFFWRSLLTPGRPFLDGLALTIIISVVSMAAALVVGLGVTLLARSRFTALRAVAGVYVWLIRGTPLLVQLVILYLGFASIGLFTFQDTNWGPLVIRGAVAAAIVGLTIHESAYLAEIMRAAIESVEVGQYEASSALGATTAGTMRWIILPQAARIMVPPMGNIFNGLMKATSVLSIIGVTEMFLVGQSLSSITFRTFEIFIVVAIYYLALTTVWTFIQAWIERRLNAQVGIVTTESVWSRIFSIRRRSNAATTDDAS